MLLPYIFLGFLSFFYTRIPFISICWLIGFIISFKKGQSIMFLFSYFVTVVILIFFKINEAFYLLTPIIIHCFNQINFHSSFIALGNFLGNISFSLYLCHYPLMLLFAPIAIGFGQIISFLTVNLISLISAVILYYCIDRNRKKLFLLFNFRRLD